MLTRSRYKVKGINFRVTFAKNEIRYFCVDVSGVKTTQYDESALHFEECLAFACGTVQQKVANANSFWRRLEAAAIHNQRCLPVWKQLFSGLIEFEPFRNQFLIFCSGCDTQSVCPNEACGKKCMVDVYEEDGKFFAACMDQSFGIQEMQPDDVKLHEFNLEHFNRKLALALKVNPQIEKVNQWLWLLGSVSLGRSKSKKIFISYAPPLMVLDTVSQLCILNLVPALVFSLHQADFSIAEDSALRRYAVEYINIGEHVSLDPWARFSVLPSLHKRFKPMEQDFRSDMAHSVRCPFNLPFGLDWPDIHLRFKDNQTLSCRIGNAHYFLSYLDFGMVDSRSGKPNHVWFFLQYLAYHHGMLKINWPTKKAADKEQQKKKQLCMALKQFFNIGSEPIIYDCDALAYHCLFSVKPDTDSTIFHKW